MARYGSNIYRGALLVTLLASLAVCAVDKEEANVLESPTVANETNGADVATEVKTTKSVDSVATTTVPTTTTLATVADDEIEPEEEEEQDTAASEKVMSSVRGNLRPNKLDEERSFAKERKYSHPRSKGSIQKEHSPPSYFSSWTSKKIRQGPNKYEATESPDEPLLDSNGDESGSNESDFASSSASGSGQQDERNHDDSGLTVDVRLTKVRTTARPKSPWRRAWKHVPDRRPDDEPKTYKDAATTHYFYQGTAGKGDEQFSRGRAAEDDDEEDEPRAANDQSRSYYASSTTTGKSLLVSEDGARRRGLSSPRRPGGRSNLPYPPALVTNGEFGGMAAAGTNSRARLTPNARLFVNMMRGQLDTSSRPGLSFGRDIGPRNPAPSPPQPPTTVIIQQPAPAPPTAPPCLHACYSAPYPTTKAPRRFVATGYILNNIFGSGPISIPSSPVMFG